MSEFTIGGSEAAASAGLDPYRSRVALWAEKTGLAEPREAGEAALWGTLLEPVIAAQVEARGYVTIPAPADGIASTEYPWMRGHLDGFVTDCAAYQSRDGGGAGKPSNGSGERERGGPYSQAHPTPTEASPLSTRGVLEVKTAGPWIKGWDNDQAPPAYIAQTHHYMQLTGLEWALLACLVGGQRLELRRIERDEAFLALLLEAEAEFVDLCVKGTPPAPDGSSATDDVLKKLYPKAHAGTIVELTAADMQTLGELRALKEAAKETERQLKEREQLVKLRLGDNEVGVYEGAQVVSYKNVVQERKAQDARTVEYRTLRV